MLKRAPYFLRVVEENEEFDALDMGTDSPRRGEKIYAYRMVGEPGWMHINARRGAGGFFTTAEYQMVPEQPTDQEMRTLPAWHKWCEAHRPPDLKHAVRANNCRHEERDMDGICKLCGLGL